MMKLLKTGLVLMIITTIAALLLAFTYYNVKPRIEEQLSEEVKQALQEVMPLADDFKQVGEEYEAYKDDELVGRIRIVEARGYSSTIKTMVGVDLVGKVTAIKILSQQETPGLGTRIEDIKPGEQKPWFQQQFKGKTIEELKLKKEGGQVDGITGATVSSKAVTDSVMEAIE